MCEESCRKMGMPEDTPDVHGVVKSDEAAFCESESERLAHFWGGLMVVRSGGGDPRGRADGQGRRAGQTGRADGQGSRAGQQCLADGSVGRVEQGGGAASSCQILCLASRSVRPA